jgi:uncharacterized protein Smg (DUF494 family)
MEEEIMSDQAQKATDLPIDRDDLEMAQEAINTAQEELHDTLEQMKEALDARNTIKPKLFQEAKEQIKELEVQANSLRKDLEKLQKQ